MIRKKMRFDNGSDFMTVFKGEYFQIWKNRQR